MSSSGSRIHAVHERRRHLYRVVAPGVDGRTLLSREAADALAAKTGGRVLIGVLTWVDAATGRPASPEPPPTSP